MVLSRVRQGPKWKAKLDMKEVAQSKWLRLMIEVPGERAEMQGEPSTREILMEQLELLMDLRELFAKQLEEVKRTRHVVSVVSFVVDVLTEWISRFVGKILVAGSGGQHSNETGASA